MDWTSFFIGLAVAAIVFGLGVGLWRSDKIKVKSWGPFVVGCVSAVVALYLITTLWTTGGFVDWLWKPVAIFATAVVTFRGIDEGVNGHRHPR